MNGKLFLLAVVCVSFVQVRGDIELENAIEEAIAGVKSSRRDLQKRFENIRTGMQEIEGIVTENYKEFLKAATLMEKWGYDEINSQAKEVTAEAKGDKKILECVARESTAGFEKLQQVKKEHIVKGNEMTEAVRKAAPNAHERFGKLAEDIKKTAEDFINKFKSQQDDSNMENLTNEYKLQFWLLETRISKVVSDMYKEVTNFEEKFDANTNSVVADLRETWKAAYQRLYECLGWE